MNFIVQISTICGQGEWGRGQKSKKFADVIYGWAPKGTLNEDERKRTSAAPKTALVPRRV